MKSHSMIISLMIILLVYSFAEARYSGGTGEPNDPYRIATAEDLIDLSVSSEDWDKHFTLVNDVKLTSNDSNQFKIIGR